jgi:uncharacterized SAM-binding protein YcdF (DUF218 family)
MVLAVVASLAAGAYLLRRPILTELGSMLVASSPLEKADAALVLSGEASPQGLRTRTAVRLYEQGWVRKLVVSGGPMGFGVHETDFSVPLAVAQGVPRNDIIAVPNSVHSTEEEAGVVCPVMERKGIRSFYVVTSNYHTGRAQRLFRHVCGERMRVLVAPAPDDWFTPDGWWHSREGGKSFLLEWLKTLHSAIE